MPPARTQRITSKGISTGISWTPKNPPCFGSYLKKFIRIPPKKAGFLGSRYTVPVALSVSAQSLGPKLMKG